jgi:hypothetical protein
MSTIITGKANEYIGAFTPKGVNVHTPYDINSDSDHCHFDFAKGSAAGILAYVNNKRPYSPASEIEQWTAGHYESWCSRTGG